MADDEQLCKNHTIGDGGEDEEKSSQSPPGKKQELDEKSDGAEDEMEDSDGAGEEDDEESDGTEEEATSNSLKSNYLPDGVEEVDVDTWIKYRQEIRESEGFDIDHYPGFCIMADCHPVETDDNVSPALLHYCVAAINEFNQKEGTDYSFEKLEKANVGLWGCGANHYLTFQAKESVADASKTFQDLVYYGIGDLGSKSAVVKFCRLKKAAAAA